MKLVILKMTMIQGLFKTFIQISEKIFTLDNLLSIHVCFRKVNKLSSETDKLSFSKNLGVSFPLQMTVVT